MESNEIVSTILLWGSIAAAVTGIVALATKAVKGVRTIIKYFADLRASVDTLLKHDKSQYLSILRLTVMSDNMPLSERIAAGKEYIDADGNGDVKHFYESQLKPYDKISRKDEQNNE